MAFVNCKGREAWGWDRAGGICRNSQKAGGPGLGSTGWEGGQGGGSSALLYVSSVLLEPSLVEARMPHERQPGGWKCVTGECLQVWVVCVLPQKGTPGPSPGR